MNGVYSVSKKLLADDVTMFRKLRPSVLFRWLQEISIAHTELLGCGRAKTLDKGCLWIIARIRAEISALPVYDDTVTLLSWPGETMHVLFPRYYELSSDDGGVLLRASALWLLMDEKKREMVFPKRLDIGIDGVKTDRETALPLGLNFNPEGNCSEFTATFSRTDINGHVNNSRYLDIMEDELGEDFLGSHDLKSIEIDFKREVRSGENVALLWRETDGRFEMTGTCAGTKRFQIAAEYFPSKIK